MIKTASLLSVLVALAVPASSLAQEPPRVRKAPTPRTQTTQKAQIAEAAIRAAAVAAAQKKSPAGSALKGMLSRNITVGLTGQLGDGSKVDLALTGCGQLFQTDVILGTTEISGNQIPTIGSLQFEVEQNDGAYYVTYSIGARLAIPTSSSSREGGVSTSIGFQEIMVSGKARCEAGKAVTIFKAGDQGLVLTVSEQSG